MELGYRVTISADPELDLSGFEAVHIWHLERVHDSWPLFRKAVAGGKPVVLSPTYFPKNNLPLLSPAGKAIKNVIENCKNLCRSYIYTLSSQKYFSKQCFKHGWLRCRNELLNGADCLIANSWSEAEILKAEMGASGNLLKVIPNITVSDKTAPENDIPWESRTRLLCVGHFCPRKNQLGLINALKDTGLKITFVGRARTMHRKYYQKCRRKAGNQHEFLDALSHDEVIDLMKEARVHICSSTIETPGIVNLEAALSGCNLVLPPVPPVMEYFNDYAIYFNDWSPESIKKAVIEAIARTVPTELKKHVQENYCLEAVKRSFKELYKDILK
jgi:glycosyltransferase involved in cell wall biosynthesis